MYFMQEVNGRNPTVFMRYKFPVQINFLPVGHTHEDVDQLCQKLERRLGKLGANHYQVGSVTTNVIDHPHSS